MDSGSGPTLSVLIVTRDRAEQLGRCLDSLEMQSRPPFEVILIDNGSSDETREIAFSYATRLPLRYLFEQTPSIPRARNVALAEARGEIALFIDDDCVADPGWLEEARRGVAIHPGAVMIQGRVESHSRTLLGLAQAVNSDAYFEHFYFHEGGGLRFARSANLLINPTASSEPLRFDVRLERSSDRELGARVIRQGHEVAYHPSMSVVHDYDGKSLVRLLARFFRNARYRDPNLSVPRFLRAIRRDLADRGRATRVRAIGVVGVTLMFLAAGAAGAVWARASRTLGRRT